MWFSKTSEAQVKASRIESCKFVRQNQEFSMKITLTYQIDRPKDAALSRLGADVITSQYPK
jgi:hypothetical protein